jgi:glutathione S-transferase
VNAIRAGLLFRPKPTSSSCDVLVARTSCFTSLRKSLKLGQPFGGLLVTNPAQPIRLHRFDRSGHSHRVELFLSLLDLPFELKEVELFKGAQRSPEFLALNPFGQVPVIEDGSVVLSDSNAILMYLAAKYAPSWIPRDPVNLAALQRWFSVAAGPLVSGLAAARAHVLFRPSGDLEAKQTAAHNLLRQINSVLERTPYLLGAELSLADIANYTYVAHAPEGGVLLDAYPAIRAWLSRVEATPRFVPMLRS